MSKVQVPHPSSILKGISFYRIHTQVAPIAEIPCSLSAANVGTHFVRAETNMTSFARRVINTWTGLLAVWRVTTVLVTIKTSGFSFQMSIILKIYQVLRENLDSPCVSKQCWWGETGTWLLPSQLSTDISKEITPLFTYRSIYLLLRRKENVSIELPVKKWSVLRAVLKI